GHSPLPDQRGEGIEERCAGVSVHRLRHLARRAGGARGVWFLAAMRSERPPILIAALATIAGAFFILPLVGLLSRAPWQTALSDLTTPEALTALRLSFVVSLAATALALVLGVPLAWVYARVPFPGRAVVRSMP